MSGGETVSLTVDIVVSSDRGELPSDEQLEDMLGEALYHQALDEDENVSVLSVGVRRRFV